MKQVKRSKDPETGATLIERVDDFYIYQEKPGSTNQGVKITAGKLSDNLNIDLADGMIHYFTTQETTTSTPNIRFNSSTSLDSSMNTGEAIAKKNSKVKVLEHTEPYSSFLGNNIYKVQHILTKQDLYISNEDIKR